MVEDQAAEIAKLKADNAAAKGVVGRMLSAMDSQDSPFKSASYSIWGNQKILEGAPLPQEIIDRKNGVVLFEQFRPKEERHRQQLDQLQVAAKRARLRVKISQIDFADELRNRLESCTYGASLDDRDVEASLATRQEGAMDGTSRAGCNGMENGIYDATTMLALRSSPYSNIPSRPLPLLPGIILPDYEEACQQ